jgi:hypothetical protein
MYSTTASGPSFFYPQSDAWVYEGLIFVPYGLVEGIAGPHQGWNGDVMHNGIQICLEQAMPKRGGENSRPNDGFGIIAAWL